MIRSCVLALYAVVYAIAMLALGGATFQKLYAPSPYHRLQADALLKGDLHIGDSLQQMRHDLAWHDGQVNHVWGLGVGLWLAPFEFLWRLAGQKWFPDRIALGVAFALLAWYSGSTSWRLGAVSRRPTFALGFVWLIVLCPAVWTLNQGGRLIYEETSLYACIVSLAILVATVRVACFAERRDFWICAILAALSALVRPTHGIYGLAGTLVCTAILWSRRRSLKTIVSGNAVFAAGLILLAITNWSRFGSPTEFGHRLTATPGLIVYMTRIDNPMKEATFVQASRELLGSLFLSKDIERFRASEKPAPGQAPYERWRDPCLTTYDLIWAVVCVTGLLGAVLWLACRLRRNNAVESTVPHAKFAEDSKRIDAGMTGTTHQTVSHTTAEQERPDPSRSLREAPSASSARRTRQWKRHVIRPTTSLIVGLFVWGGLSVAALSVFYLKLPTFSYRYLLDFAPAFTALAMLTWFWIARWPAWIVLPALGAWLGYEIVSGRIIPGPVPLRDRSSAVTALDPSEGTPIAGFDGRYGSPTDPERTGISYNGYGWHEENHLAGAIVTVAVDRPHFVELEVEPRVASDDGPVRSDVYRAMIDNCFLPRSAIRVEADRVHVRFDVPESIRARNGDELLFLCFTSGYDKPDRDSKRLLHSVRWR